MYEKRIAAREGELLTLDEMTSNVVLRSWDEPEILVRLPDGSEEHLQVQEGGTGPEAASRRGPVISARVSCELLVPSHMPVAIRQVAGNLTVKTLTAPLNAEQIRGNLTMSSGTEAVFAEVYGNLKAKRLSVLRVAGTIYGDAHIGQTQSVELQNIRGNLRAKEVGHLRVSRVGGNLSGKQIKAHLDAEQIGGNALLDGIAGPASLARVAGNLSAKNLSSGAKATRIGGNLVLSGELGTGCTYQFKVDGNAILRLAEGSSAYLHLTAQGRVRTPEGLADRKVEGQAVSGTLGDGGAEIVVEAQGHILVNGDTASEAVLRRTSRGADLGAEWCALCGEEISRQVEKSLQAIGQQASEEMEAALSRLRIKLETADWERLGEQARRAIEVAMERVQKKIDRLAQKAARHQAHVERHIHTASAHGPHLSPRTVSEARAAASIPHLSRGTVSEGKDAPAEAGLRAEQPESGPDLEQERLTILRMVEQGQITPEEAEMLMDALL